MALSLSSVSETFRHPSTGCLFKLKRVEGDGNCLFRCMADAVLGDVNKHGFIRNKIVQHICENWTDFADFSPDLDEIAYRNRMGKDKEFGGEAEIKSFTSLFKIKLIIYFEGNVSQEPLWFDNEGPLGFVLFSGRLDRGHYDIMYPIKTLWCNEVPFKAKMTQLWNKNKEMLQKEIVSFDLSIKFKECISKRKNPFCENLVCVGERDLDSENDSES